MASGDSRPRTIEEICSVNGHTSRPVPPLPPTSVPNFEEIRKVYDTFFSSGLDLFLDTDASEWFQKKGFVLLANDRSLLARFLSYLTLISNTSNPNATSLEHSALASQEAHMVWALLNLLRSAQENGDDEAEPLARRVKAIEALLTGEPIIRTSSMLDFVNQEDPEPDQDTDMNMNSGSHIAETIMSTQLEQTPFQKQLSARSEDFWKLVEKAAERPSSIPADLFDQTRSLLYGMENRDVIHSIMILAGGPSNGNGNGGGNGHGQGSRPGTSAGYESNNSSPNRALRRQEKEQAARLLENEASGRATNLVLQNIAGMAVRAFMH